MYTRGTSEAIRLYRLLRDQLSPESQQDHFRRYLEECDQGDLSTPAQTPTSVPVSSGTLDEPRNAPPILATGDRLSLMTRTIVGISPVLAIGEAMYNLINS